MLSERLEERSRKYKEYSLFDQSNSGNYYLLPFKFHRLNESKEIVVNEVGDFLILSTGTVKRIIEKKINKNEEPDLYADLISSFFISESQLDPLIDLLATRYRTKKSFLDEFTSLHIFVITLRCDHSCQYCQVSRVSQDKNQFDMSIEHINKSIDMMLMSPSRSITMEFQGGESLLSFEKVAYAVERTEKLSKGSDKDIQYVICTNLSQITDEILDYCKAHKILISTSLDGHALVHNSNRRRQGNNSYELATQGIKRCIEKLGIDRISALMTTTSLSLKYPLEIVDEYYNLGFKNIFLRSVSPYGFAVKNEKYTDYTNEDFLDFYKKALNRIIEYNLNGECFKEDYTTIILKKILTPFPVSFVDLNSPSGAIVNAIVFNYDGGVYVSDEGRMLAEMKDYTFKLGHLDSHSYKEIFYGEIAQKVSQFTVNESLPGCSECAFQCYCGADPVRNHATQGDMVGYRPTNAFCIHNLNIITHLFELMDNDPKVKTIFEMWVSDK
jgi:His-Xaa-Ser system radical SAM maturase HxsB